MHERDYEMKGANRMTARPARVEHFVRCWHCGEKFELLRAAWCGCGVRVERPSKRCPYCLKCVCDHPDYLNEALWGEAPPYLKDRGFSRLFYLYL